MSTVLIFVALITALIGIAYLYVKNAFSYWKRRSIPYIQPTFPFGNSKEILLQRSSSSEGVRKLYECTTEPVLGVYTSIFPALLVRDPKIIQRILVTDFSSFRNRRSYAGEHDPMARMVLLQNGEKWKTARTKISPAFTSGKLKGMFDTVVASTESLNEFIGQYADYKKSVEISDVFGRYTTNVIASVGFGLDIDCIKNPNSDFRKYGKRVFESNFINGIRNVCIFFIPSMSKLFRVRVVDKDVGDFMIRTVKENLKYREDNNIVRKDIFQMLMQLRNAGKIEDKNDDWSIKSANSKKTLSLEEMSAQAYLFIVAGYETASNAMSFFLYEIAKDQNAQQKVYAEIQSVLEQHDDQLTYESINEMNYIDNCIEETLRMHSPIGTVGRVCMEDYKVPDSNITIEKGTHIIISIDGIHYDPQYYKEPNEFKPERFAERKKENRSFLEMPFLSFGIGSRNCLGIRLGKLQMKIGIIKVLQKFRFELAEQHSNGVLEISPKGLVKTSIYGINLNVFTR